MYNGNKSKSCCDSAFRHCGVMYLLCAIAFALAPGLALAAVRNLFHGINISPIAKPVVWSTVFVGLIEIMVYTAIAGWLFAVIYNYASRKSG